MTEHGNPVLDLESQTTAIATDDNITTTWRIPGAPAPPPLPPPPRKHRLTKLTLSPPPPPLRLTHPSTAVYRRAYQFDGLGHFKEKEWDIAEGTDNKFCWYHLQIDPHHVKPDAYAHILIDSFCPPLKLLDIISLVNDGPFCSSYMDGGVLIFGMHSTGLANGDFPFRLAARVSQNSLITVSWGFVPRLLYNKYVSGGKPLFKVPQLERYPGPLERKGMLELNHYYISTKKFVDGQPVDEQHDLADLFSEARGVQQPDCTVPTTVASLVVHVIDTHVDLIRQRIANIEKELNLVEEKWVDGDFEHNKKLMDDVNFSEMQLKLQRILQVIAETEQVLHQVKDKCRNIEWLKVLADADDSSLQKVLVPKVPKEEVTTEDTKQVKDERRNIHKVEAVADGSSLQEILVRPKVLRENVKILANRIEASRGRLVDIIQSEQINRRVYILSFVSLIFLPLTIITGVFSMQVRGVPWTGQKHPYGFRNVVIVGIIAALGIWLLYLIIPAIYHRVAVRLRQKCCVLVWFVRKLLWYS